MRFPEGDPFSVINEDEEIEGFRDYLAEVEMGVMQETLKNDLVARQCDYVRFTSYSKGRDRYGGRRRRRYAVEVELVGRGKRHIQLNEGGLRGLDRWAEEVLGESVPADEALAEFIRRLRELPRLRKIASGKK